MERSETSCTSNYRPLINPKNIIELNWNRFVYKICLLLGNYTQRSAVSLKYTTHFLWDANDHWHWVGAWLPNIFNRKMVKNSNNGDKGGIVLLQFQKKDGPPNLLIWYQINAPSQAMHFWPYLMLRLGGLILSTISAYVTRRLLASQRPHTSEAFSCEWGFRMWMRYSHVNEAINVSLKHLLYGLNGGILSQNV